ncbi:hypothetical protein NDU88_003284 [Pleurodeles waltl]|uniref:Uncharacterized protein n=1 Tax=Pleurodeles waltl TaxID=8319 RepID=A0AAV7TP91_PLEWA|nr:hypothetical protein NDU88_003284 [Pleurodeles waltl]
MKDPCVAGKVGGVLTGPLEEEKIMLRKSKGGMQKTLRNPKRKVPVADRSESRQTQLDQRRMPPPPRRDPGDLDRGMVEAATNSEDSAATQESCGLVDE